MKTIAAELTAIQNLGLSDRMIRLIFSAVFLASPAYHLALFDAHFALQHGVLMLLSIYPGLTAFLGWDPFYQMAYTKSCGATERNQCGTLPYQVDAALGHHPIPNDDWDHSLAGSHH